MEKNRLLLFSIPLIVILLVLVAYQYGYQRVQSQLAVMKEEETAKSRTLAKYTALVAEKPELQKQLAALKELRKTENSKLMEGQTPSIIAASLSETVKGMITARGGTTSSERVSKPETLGKFTVINVSMDVTFPDTRALADVLYAIETRTPYLVVKELDARIKNFNDPRELSVKLDVSALAGGR